MRSRGGPALVALLLVLMPGLPGRAAVGQAPQLELDLNASRIQYDTLDGLDAPSASLLLQWRRPRLFTRVSGGVTGFENAGWSAEARGSLAGWLAPWGWPSPLRLELGAGAGVSRHSEGFRTASGRLDGRLHYVGSGAGGWVGASWGVAENAFDSAAVSGVMPGAGLWARSRRLQAMVGYEHARISGLTYPELSGVLTLSDGPIDFIVYGGARLWPDDLGGGEELWGGATAAYWLTDHAAVLLSGGSYASDVLQGLPGGDVFTIGLRLTPRRVRPVPREVSAPIVYTGEDAARGTIGFDVGDADRVDIAGDWNGWRPVPLVREEGQWILATPLEPGTYRFNLWVDEERWVVPEGVPTIDDGFGGTVGLLIISSSS